MFHFDASCHATPIVEEETKDVAYVTRSTYTRLSGSWLQPVGRVSIDWIFGFIYEESLAAILNQPEAERLYVRKLMLEGKFRALRIKNPKFSPKYVFSVGTPKFHQTNACRCLTADFINYRVPLEIKVRGSQKIREFQEYCEQLKKELEGRSDDIFWARVNARFHIHAEPEQVCYENSGVQDIAAMPIAELQKKICKTVDASREILNGEDDAVIKNIRYAPSRKKALACTSNLEQRKIVEQFFKLKWQLIDLLFELYRKQAGAVDYVLPLHLLQASGLEPCRKCWR